MLTVLTVYHTFVSSLSRSRGLHLSISLCPSHSVHHTSFSASLSLSDAPDLTMPISICPPRGLHLPTSLCPFHYLHLTSSSMCIVLLPSDIPHLTLQHWSSLNLCRVTFDTEWDLGWCYIGLIVATFLLILDGLIHLCVKTPDKCWASLDDLADEDTSLTLTVSQRTSTYSTVNTAEC